MSDIYTGFSNYSEINAEDRKTALKKEIAIRGNAPELFLKYRKEWNRAANENYLPEHPLHVDIELSDACNLSCQMCAHGIGEVNNVGFMDKDLAYKLIDECSEMGVYSIKFNWRGESVLCSYLADAVKYAKEKGVLEVQINTNGLPKRDDVLIDCAESGIDRIIFSVDGFLEKTYEQIRIGGDYKKLLNNIHVLLDWKKVHKAAKPFIRVQMVRSIVNSGEVKDFINYWQPLVDDVRISDVMNRGQGNQMSVGDQVVAGRRRCPQPFQRLVIGRDGRVSPCCADWNQEYVVGNVENESLKSIWRNARMQNIRDIQNNMEHHKINICSNCYVKESFVWKKNEKN